MFRSTLLHLRFPFSYFLLPVYLFALSVSPNFNAPQLLWSFVVIHFLLYPASNGYNSYFDRDEKAIGGLKHPPPVHPLLYYTAWLLDLAAIGLGYVFINGWFALMLLIYGLVSKAYSHPVVRLKKYPVAGWLTVSVFQGFFTFLLCYVGINKFGPENLLAPRVWVPALLATLQLLGTYPMTQIYQHEEDRQRGDQTISLRLGIRGTFVFVLVFFLVSSAGFVFYFFSFGQAQHAMAFFVALGPVAVYFLWWMQAAFRNPAAVTYGRTMWLNFLSATCLNGFFIWLFLQTSHVGQL